MGQSGRFVRHSAEGVGVVLAFLVSAAGIGYTQSPPNYPALQSRPEATYLDQGWGYDTAEWWYHVSQGTIFMPYQWFVSLEQASGDELFATTDHLERLGFIADLPSA